MANTNEDNMYPFADRELAQRLERAEAHSNARFVEARARAFPTSGAGWIEVAGTYALYDGVESPVTQTFGLGMFEPVTDAVLDEIEGFFRERGAPTIHEVSPLAGVSVMALLHERGYSPVELSSVMYRPIQGDMENVLAQTEGIQVRSVGPEENAVWTETTVKGWSHLTEAAEFLRDIGQINAQRENAVSFLAEREGNPIAAAALCISGGVAQMAGASTIPEGRRQGAQLALLYTRLRYAAEHGCNIAMICAEPGSASQRNAERHGFRIAYTRTKWQLGGQNRGDAEGAEKKESY